MISLIKNGASNDAENINIFQGNHFLNGFVGCIYSLDISNRYVRLPDADGGEEENNNSNQKSWHGSLKEILEVRDFPLFIFKSNILYYFHYLKSFPIQFFIQSIFLLIEYKEFRSWTQGNDNIGKWRSLYSAKATRRSSYINNSNNY